MNELVNGLHHLTAMTSDAQKNVDFYAGVLGLRLVKKTVNFDAPDVYHLYFGNETGQPGTIITFFPFNGMVRGKKGTGQVTVTSFSVAEGSLDYWTKRLSRFGVVYRRPDRRFNEEYIYFEDYDGLGLELVASGKDNRKPYTNGNIPEEFSIKGFYGVTLSEDDEARTIRLLSEQMDHSIIDEKDNLYRLSAQGNTYGFVDILISPNGARGRGGAGTVHHVAFATPDDSTQLKLREKLLDDGMVEPTPVADRQYFHSIYFREPGGVLFEAATCDIGFTLDEPAVHLGENLKLPPWEEKNRHEIEKFFVPVHLNAEKFSDYARV
jgi:glyoxalase family protein